MRPLAIMRPEPGASETASAARNLGLETIVIPLFAVKPVEWRAPAPEHFDGLLMTSANAVRHAGKELERLKGMKAHCVGETTASQARFAGLEVASVGASNLDALLQSLPAGLRLLHLCGADRREPKNPKQTIEHMTIYRAAELPTPEGLERLEGAVVAAHSPRAAARLSDLVREKGLRREGIALVAISEATAMAAGAGWERLDYTCQPTDAALLALAAALCNNRR